MPLVTVSVGHTFPGAEVVTGLEVVTAAEVVVEQIVGLTTSKTVCCIAPRGSHR